MIPVVTYDQDANAAYIRFSPKPVEESEGVSAGIVLDYDATGHIVGMEILDGRAHLSPEVLHRSGLTTALPTPRCHPGAGRDPS